METKEIRTRYVWQAVGCMSSIDMPVFLKDQVDWHIATLNEYELENMLRSSDKVTSMLSSIITAYTEVITRAVSDTPLQDSIYRYFMTSYLDKKWFTITASARQLISISAVCSMVTLLEIKKYTYIRDHETDHEKVKNKILALLG